MKIVCGVDEAGRGCLAGPIYAGAVILGSTVEIDGLRDSKLLSPKRRLELELEIKANAVAFGLGHATVKEIDRRGIEWANRIAFTRAVKNLLRSTSAVSPADVTVYIDGNRRAQRLGMEQVTVVGGDRKVPEISAASILAKTARDRYVVRTIHTRYPQYGFDRHKGYATRRHTDAIAVWGPTSSHRMSFNLTGKRSELEGGE